MISKDNLPTSVEELQALCLQLHSDLSNTQTDLSKTQTDLHEEQARSAQLKNWLALKEAQVQQLEERLSLLLSKHYQSNNEQLHHLQGQLFDEAELEQAIQQVYDEIEQVQAELSEHRTGNKSEPKAKPKRTVLPAHLRRVEIIVDVSDEDKQMMGDDWELIGYETSEQLAVNQREYYVKQIKRAKYALKTTSKDETANGIKVAPPANVILPKALPDASLLADVLAAKFVDAVPFYRKMKILEREGIHIGYSTVCDWPIQLVKRLEPIKRLLYQQLPQYERWHLDETLLQVLNEPNRKNTSNSYLWGIRAGPPDKQVVLFHYDSSRGYEALRSWLSPCLEEFKGVIVTDEHKPYNTLCREYPNIKAHGGCWSHLRRKFTEAAKGRKATSEAHKMLAMIAALYRLENSLNKTLFGEDKLNARRKKLVPQVEKIKAYLDQLNGIYLGDGLMHKAIYYALNNWPKFTAFLDHPELPIDNNPMEQAIRPFTLGRKNFLFSGGPQGAHASAFIYSLVETAKACGWEPKAYLQTLFERFPYARNENEMRNLLPMFLKPGK